MKTGREEEKLVILVFLRRYRSPCNSAEPLRSRSSHCIEWAKKSEGSKQDDFCASSPHKSSSKMKLFLAPLLRRGSRFGDTALVHNQELYLFSKKHAGGRKSGYTGEEADGEDSDRCESKKWSNVRTLNRKKIDKNTEHQSK